MRKFLAKIGRKAVDAYRTGSRNAKSKIVNANFDTKKAKDIAIGAGVGATATGAFIKYFNKDNKKNDIENGNKNKKNLKNGRWITMGGRKIFIPNKK